MLVVEDDPDIAQLVVHYLGKAGFSTETVANGREAIGRHHAARPPDLLDSRPNAPHVDGLEVCRLAHSNEATAGIPVIMLTAHAEKSDGIGGLELGADDDLAKPFSPNELVGARPRTASPRGKRSAARRETARPTRPMLVETGQLAVVGGRQDGRRSPRRSSCCWILPAEHRGRVLSREGPAHRRLGLCYTGGTRTVDVHVRRLREKLPLLASALVTVKQFGYKLLEDPNVTSD